MGLVGGRFGRWGCVLLSFGLVLRAFFWVRRGSVTFRGE